MNTQAWDAAFLDTTRGNIVQILRRGPRTVLELSDALGLAANTVRTHLGNLERDKLVQHVGKRRGHGAGKPAHIYQLTPDTESKFSRAYVPVLHTLVELLMQRMPKEDFQALIEEVGSRLAPATVTPETNNEQRMLVAREILEGLGGVISESTANGAIRIEGAGCPLGEIVAHRPEVCGAVRSLLSSALGMEFRAICHRGDRPACRFESTQQRPG